MKLVQTNTGNSRFLYTDSLERAQDWFLISQKIEKFMACDGRFQSANGDTFIYFFAPAGHQDFFAEDVWVGKEVIGPGQIEHEEIAICDLTADICWSYDFEMERYSSWRQIFALENELRQISSLKFASSWRIRIAYPQELQYAKIELFEWFQFPENEGGGEKIATIG